MKPQKRTYRIEAVVEGATGSGEDVITMGCLRMLEEYSWNVKFLTVREVKNPLHKERNIRIISREKGKPAIPD